MLWKTVVGKLWLTIMLLVAVVLLIVGFFLLVYVDFTYTNSRDVEKLFAVTGVIGFLLTTFFAFFLLTKITQPLVQLKQAAVKITQGDYSTRVPIRSSDEIGELANTFNHMAEQMEATIRDLNHEKENLSSVLRSMADAVITFDAEGYILLANPHGEKLMKDWSEIRWTEDPLPEENRIPEPLQGLFESVVKGNREVSTNLHVQNGVWSVVLAPLYSMDMVRGAVAVLRDVTEQHRLDKLRKDFVANVSHELRTPLSMLQGYSEALLDDIADSPEQRKELAQVILDESLRMGRLVKDLLDLARMEAGHFEMQFAELDLQALIQRIHRKFYTLCKDRKVDLILDIGEGKLPKLFADADRLEQVFTNLLDNALRHTPQGEKIAIRIRCLHPRQNEPDCVRIDIIDTGLGIPPEDLPYIFERFYKADKARTRASSSGTGLGLSLVKNMVEAHKGKVTVESTLGKGTTFSVILPCLSA